GCNHNWCAECLKSLFEAALKDRSIWPPSCCNKTAPFMDLDTLALNLLDRSEYNRFISKIEEYQSKDPLYCPEKTCSAFIPKSNIHRDGLGSEYGICEKCDHHVCVRCRQTWHPDSFACKKDKDTKQFEELVEKEMWARCPSCSNVIELNQGCNHMTCICGHQFCYVC
ncbi:hypothetical protein BDZ91DRAFT_638502, partial [Kalaharituber pfeilii]